MIRPAALFPTARVALIAPAGPVSEEATERATERVRRWGWEPVLGKHARGRRGYLSGTDAERLADLNGALRDPEIDAIWCLRGGYGTMRLLEGVDWEALRDHPRPLIGFSDNTALHLGCQRIGVVSFHGPHPAAECPRFSEELLRQLLLQRNPLGQFPIPSDVPAPETIIGGCAEGPLVGGNLALIAATLGTPFAIRAEGAILFLEEVGEAAYRIDRLLSQLRLAGVLNRVAGVALGAFSDCPDAGRDGIPAPADVIRDRLGGCGVPVATGFPFGHIPQSWTLPLGVRARLNADAGTLDLLEAAVA